MNKTFHFSQIFATNHLTKFTEPVWMIHSRFRLIRFLGATLWSACLICEQIIPFTWIFAMNQFSKTCLDNAFTNRFFGIAYWLWRWSACLIHEPLILLSQIFAINYLIQLTQPIWIIYIFTNLTDPVPRFSLLAMFQSTYFYVHFGILCKKNAGWKCQDVHKFYKCA